MTRDELAAAATAIYGFEWQSALARAIGCDARTVRRWAAGKTPVPDWLPARLADLAGGAVPFAGPVRDEWLRAEATDSHRTHLVHAWPPRFIGRLVDGEGTGARGFLPEDYEAEDGVDLANGHVYGLDPTQVLAEIVWIDPPPSDVNELAALFERAADAVERWEDRQDPLDDEDD